MKKPVLILVILLVVLAAIGGTVASLILDRNARIEETSQQFAEYLQTAAEEAYVHVGIDTDKTSIAIRDMQTELGWGVMEYQTEVTYVFTSLADYEMTDEDVRQVAFQAALIYDNNREDRFSETYGKDVMTFINDKGIIYENINVILDGEIIRSAERSRESMVESIKAFEERERAEEDAMYKSMKYAASSVRKSYYPPRSCPVCGTGYVANSTGARLIGERGYCKSICRNRLRGEE